MDENSKQLIKKFVEISREKWIKSTSNSWGAIGLTFEKKIKKEPDSTYNPDYLDIEIKCISRFSRYPLFLFTIAFDGPEENEITRITEKYGWYDKDYKERKVIFKRVNELSVNDKYNFKFEINNKEEKIYLYVTDFTGNTVEKHAFITFYSLKNHLCTKLKKLAIIKASVRKQKGEKYFRYYEMSLYKLKGFKDFLKLVEDGTLRIEIISRISKSGIDKGRYRNKNVVFSINKKEINKLFDCYYSVKEP